MTEEEVTEQVPDEESKQEAEETPEPTLSEQSEALVAEVAAADDELAADLEAHLADLESEKEEAKAEAEDFESRLKRKQADFQNYKKRAKKRQEQMEARATEDLVERLLDVRDNLKRAVEDDHENVESLKEGVEMTLKELDRVFADEDVAEIDPDPGAETDPQRHEVMMKIDSEHPEGTVADVYQPGYEMGEKVLRPAQVTVSDSDDDT
ncbi:nucleotide exchange factor GrpE [Halorussus halophilus]|uniref:nucleotide exchange factor GrpE n=1 Tax=Halorussus halophilus TaxID=2650975 RepID=UPI0013019795|nr:nucleotide exchange factor GrpE [Halorussus halophilus]